MPLSQLKTDQRCSRRDDNKKSMLSRLLPEGGSLFKLLLAKRWRVDGNPKFPDLTKKILVDQDSQRAPGEMKLISEQWSGKIIEKGILHFLTNGYAVNSISKAPGGVSIFMFSPLDTSHSFDEKRRIVQVKSIFRSTELDEDSIKYFAKNNFYLAIYKTTICQA